MRRKRNRLKINAKILDWNIKNPSKYKERVNKFNNSPKRKEYMKSYRLVPKNKESELFRCREYKKRNRIVAKRGHLKRKFKLTMEQYLRMQHDQNNKCAICRKEETSIHSKNGKIRDLAVDHCHLTGKIRGLLCFACNSSLGRLKDSIQTLTSAIRYLQKNQNNDTIPNQDN